LIFPIKIANVARKSYIFLISSKNSIIQATSRPDRGVTPGNVSSLVMNTSLVEQSQTFNFFSFCSRMIPKFYILNTFRSQEIQGRVSLLHRERAQSKNPQFPNHCLWSCGFQLGLYSRFLKTAKGWSLFFSYSGLYSRENYFWEGLINDEIRYLLLHASLYNKKRRRKMWVRPKEPM
jgi:hypothetical protein